MDGLNAMMGRVANTTGVHFVDINSQSGGHDMCKGATVRWVEGLFPNSINGGPALQTPLHPNTAGTNAQASFVINAVSAVTPPTATALAVPDTTEVPATEPPATDPATTAPPATAPPATEPPVTEPPVTEAPTTTTAP